MKNSTTTKKLSVTKKFDKLLLAFYRAVQANLSPTPMGAIEIVTHHLREPKPDPTPSEKKWVGVLKARLAAEWMDDGLDDEPDETPSSSPVEPAKPASETTDTADKKPDEPAATVQNGSAGAAGVTVTAQPTDQPHGRRGRQAVTHAGSTAVVS